MNNKRNSYARKKRNSIIFGMEVFFIIIMVVVILNSLVKIIAPTKSIQTDVKGYANNEEVLDNKMQENAKEVNYNIGKPENRSIQQAREVIQKFSKKDVDMKTIYKSIKQYPENLVKALANNPEMKEFVLGYGEEQHRRGGLTNKEKKQRHPLLIQWDERWGYNEYGDDNIGLSGCGPTALSMVIYSLTKNAKATPDAVAQYSMNNGFYVEGIGTAWALMTEGAWHYGVNGYEISLDMDVIISHLDKGDMIICAMGQGDFTANGHFIVVYGHDKNSFFVNDPNSRKRSSKKWSYEKLKNQIKMLWAYSLEK